MKRLHVTVLLLGLIVLSTPPISTAAISSGYLSIGGTTIVQDGKTVANSGDGWTYNNQVLTLHGYHGYAISVANMGEFTMALAPGTASIISGPNGQSDGAGIAVGDNTTLIIQGALGATLEIAGSGTMETGIYGTINTATIIFSMAAVNMTGVNYCILSHGAVELQNSSALNANSLNIGVCLSGAPLTVNHSVLNSGGSGHGIMIDNHTMAVENGSTVTALSTGGDGINVINGAVLIDQSAVNTTGMTGINAMGSTVSISNQSHVTASAGGDGIYADRSIEINDSAVEAMGGASGLFSFDDIAMAASQVSASGAAGTSILADTGNVSVLGGTVNAPEGVSAGAITLDGGSLNAPTSLVLPQPLDLQGRPVFKTSITLPGLSADCPVTEVIVPPVNYDVTGMVTDGDGMIFPWISADSAITGVTAGEQHFTGQIPGGSSGSLVPTANFAPGITNTETTLIAGKGASASLTITVTGNPPPIFSATLSGGDPLPPWITLDSHTGQLTATPTPNLVPGDYVVRVTATNASGSAVKDFTVRVDEVPPTGDSGNVFFAGINTLLALLSFCGMALWRRRAWHKRT